MLLHWGIQDGEIVFIRFNVGWVPAGRIVRARAQGWVLLGRLSERSPVDSHVRVRSI